MAEAIFQDIELLPKILPVKQLFILLHGIGAQPSDLVPLAIKLKATFPDAAYLVPQGNYPFEGGNKGRQWFSVRGVTEDNRVARVAETLPMLQQLVRNAQHRYKTLQSDTALVGFSQGAIMVLEFSVAHDGQVGRVLAFSGRFAKLPEKAPELTTLHLLHGEDDKVISVAHASAGYARLMQLQGDATLDVASSVSHEIHAALAERAIHRLQTCIPLRSWKQALNSA
ncbi:MAG: esterase [Gallionella sp.]|jgi:phospholipase/carboxylesterase